MDPGGDLETQRKLPAPNETEEWPLYLVKVSFRAEKVSTFSVLELQTRCLDRKPTGIGREPRPLCGGLVPLAIRREPGLLWHAALRRG